MMNLPQITAEQFEQITKENKETCIVVFSKETCSVCKQLAPVAEKWLLSLKAKLISMVWM